MLGRAETFKVAAILVLIAVMVATLATQHRRAPASIVETTPTVAAQAPDDLTAELRRCGAFGPTDAEDARCAAVWEENRRRFFGRPARPLPPEAAPFAGPTAAPATNPSPSTPGAAP